MTHPWRPGVRTSWLAGILVVGLAAVLTSQSASNTPIYLGGDEAHFGVQSRSIAQTGHDLSGQLLPLFVHLIDPIDPTAAATRWYQPMLFYSTAGVLKFLPLTEASIRLPILLVGILDIGLMYATAKKILGDTFYAVVAALMLLLSPAHFLFSRQAMDYILPLPFVLGWLFCLVIIVERGGLWRAFGGGLILGLGFYSYIAAWFLMPGYLLLTWLALRRSGPSPLRTALMATVGFLLPVLPALAWLWTHPAMLQQTFARYRFHDGGDASLLQAAAGFLSADQVRDKLSVYWSSFNPAFLFLSGGSGPTTGTRLAGVFLVPVALFLIVGITDLFDRRRSEPMATVLLAGLALAPIPAALVGENYAIQRELVMLPFVILVGSFGLVRLLRHASIGVRALAIMLLAAMPLQYAFFSHDYFNDYQIRSSARFDPINFRGVAESILAITPSPAAIYLSRNLDDGAARWRFYAAKHGREDLLPRTRYFDPETQDARQAPVGSVLVLYQSDPSVPRLAEGAWSVATAVVDARGVPSAVVMRKTAPD